MLPFMSKSNIRKSYYFENCGIMFFIYLFFFRVRLVLVFYFWVDLD